MSSAFLALVNAVQAELVPAIVPAIGRQRRRRLTDDQDTAVNVFLTRAQASALYAGPGTPLQCLTALQIECIVRATAPATPDAAIDPLWQSVHQRLIASTPLRDLGFNADDEISIEWDQLEDDSRIAAVLLTYRVRHQAPTTL